MSFKTLTTGMIEYLGEKQTSALKSHYQFLLNLGMQFLSEEHPWDFLRRRGVLKLFAPKIDGGVDMVNGSREVTANGATFTFDQVGGELTVTVTDDANLYEVESFDAATGKLTLTFPFQGATVVNANYKIVKRLYTLNHDVAHIHVGVIRTENQLVTGIGDVQADYIDPKRDNEGTPRDIALQGYTDKNLWDVGTVTVTKDNDSVTGASTLWETELQGRSFRVELDDRLYRVKSITNSVTLTLEEKYRGATASAKVYAIEPAESAQVSFEFEIPSKDMLYQFLYSRQHPWLEQEVEYPKFPTRVYPTIYALVKWWLVMEEGKGSDIVQVHKTVYDELLSKYKPRHDMIAPKFAIKNMLQVRRPRLRGGLNVGSFPSGFGHGGTL